MTKTNVLATKETVKALEGMDFAPIKVLEALGYNYAEKNDCVGRNEEWKEHRYTGINPENPEDIAVVTVGERESRDDWNKQYIYLENEDGEDWRFKICIDSNNKVDEIYKINTPTEALIGLEEEIVGKKADWLVAPCDAKEGDEFVDWDDICTAYNLQLHGTDWINDGDAEYEQVGFNEEVRVAVLYVDTEDAPEVTLRIDDDGEIYEVV